MRKSKMFLSERETYAVRNVGVIRWFVESVCRLCKTFSLLTKNAFDSSSNSVAVRCGYCSNRRKEHVKINFLSDN
jgi:hypothetical protein